ncbi:MAG: hemerythrin cation binding domain protein [Ignavibacteria bacterium]|nr:hemerythrin cation binding domain protein [Ignavibacteria bacterium]
MSELINNSNKRKELLKHMILKLHDGEAPEDVNRQLIALLKKVPYGEVVEVEQELINEGLPEQEVLRLCDVHTKALEGAIDTDSAKPAPPGHPADTFLQENKLLLEVVSQLEEIYTKIKSADSANNYNELFLKMRGLFNSLMDVDKHYQRKENLLFPFLEKNGITGPPKVMWGKHDETREFLKAAIEALSVEGDISAEDAQAAVDFVLKQASDAVADMTLKEEQILLPMCMDRLTEIEWYEIYRQTSDYGYCLYDPKEEWKPDGLILETEIPTLGDAIKLSTGSFNIEELEAVFAHLPVDITLVDKDDKVKFFSNSKDRIFSRSRAILGRDVRYCHPPSSVNIVDQIVADFRSGKASKAPFWITLHGRFILIEYYALRNEAGEYLGTLEVSRDLTEERALEGEQRLLSYSKEAESGE